MIHDVQILGVMYLQQEPGLWQVFSGIFKQEPGLWQVFSGIFKNIEYILWKKIETSRKNELSFG